MNDKTKRPATWGPGEDVEAAGRAMSPILYVDLADLAAALGGTCNGASGIVCPGPGHGGSDRSLSIKIDPASPEGFVLFSHAGDDFGKCRDLVKEAVRDLPKGRQRTFHPSPRHEERESFKLGKALWEGGMDLSGSIGETYLAARGLDLPATNRLRFAKATWRGPAMVALITDVADNTIGFHVTFLRRNGSWTSDIAPKRQIFGSKRGGAIRLGPVAPSLIVAEGIETGLTATRIDEEGRPAWAAVDAGNLARLELPPEVRTVWIVPDGDERGTSRKAAEQARERWRAEGREVVITKAKVRPGSKGWDLNDEWMEAQGLKRPPALEEEQM